MSSTDVFVLWLKIAIFYIDLPSFLYLPYTPLYTKEKTIQEEKVNIKQFLLSSKIKLFDVFFFFKLKISFKKEKPFSNKI